MALGNLHRLFRSENAVQVVYEGRNSDAVTTHIKLDSRQDAVRFYTAWRGGASKLRIFEFELNPPEMPYQVHIMQYHNPQMEISYSAWQDDKWVTIIKFQGAFPAALSLSKNIKAFASSGYQASE